MPELPDITVYLEALETRVIGQVLENIRIASPFLLRTFDPPVESLIGQRARRVDAVREKTNRTGF